MASVRSRNTGVSSTSNTNSFTIGSSSKPASISVGDILLVIFSVDGNPTVSMSGWNKLGQASYDSTVTGAVFWKKATQSDIDNDWTVSTTLNEQASWATFALSGALGILGANANGSGSNSNPPSLNTLLTKTYLWIATRSGDSTTVASAQPSGYGNHQSQAAGGTGGASTNTAELSHEDYEENPGTFTSSSEQWVSWTLAVVPDDEGPVIIYSESNSDNDQTSIGHGISVPTGWENRGILFLIGGYDDQQDGDISDIDYNGDSATRLRIERDSGDGASWTEAWWLANPDEVDTDYDMTFSGQVNVFDQHVFVLANVDTSQPDAENGDNVGGTGGDNLSVTTVADKSVVFSMIHAANSGCSPDAPQRELYSTSAGYIVSSLTDYTTPAGSVNHSYDDDMESMVIFSISPPASGTETNDERDAKITGSVSVNSERAGKVTGKDTTQSERSGKITGKTGASSERSAKLVGEDTTESERSAKIIGSVDANSERSAKVSGTDTANSERSAKIVGQDTSESERSGKVTGADSDNDQRSAKVVGQDASSSERNTKVTGQDTSESERSAKISGTDSLSSSRSAKITGKASTSSERSAKITGQQGASSERSAKISGTDTSNSERSSKIHGKDTASSERSAKVTGIEGANSQRGAKISGTDTDTSERSGTIHGQSTDSSERSSKITGSEISNSERIAKISGGTNTSSERLGKITGQDTSSSERSSKITGAESTSNQRSAKITGVYARSKKIFVAIVNLNPSVEIININPLVSIEKINPLLDITKTNPGVEIENVSNTVEIERV